MTPTPAARIALPSQGLQPDWPALADAVRNAWHQHTHLHAGRHRVVVATLCLGNTHAQDSAKRQRCLDRLAQHLAGDGAQVEVLILPSLAQPELRLQWAAWSAPPPTQGATNSRQPHPTPIHPGATTMKLRDLFHSRSESKPTPAQEPQLEPSPQRHDASTSRSQRLSQALARMADSIAAQEVQDLVADMPGARYHLLTLTLWVSAANAQVLRSLMDLAQRDQASAIALLNFGFAKAGASARLLDTSNLRLEFARADSLPAEASEVLLVTGRETITLGYHHTGRLDLVTVKGRPASPGSAAPGQTARAGTAIAGTTHAATSVAPANAELLLWCQPHPSAALSQWRFAGGSVSVGAADDAQVQIDQSHVSGQHLSLHCDPAGAWHVEDVSRNGCELFDPDTATRPAAQVVNALHPLLATGPRALQRLSKGQALALPRQGALRLGPLPSDPLLHFVQLASAAALPVQPAAPPRRATKIAV